MIFERFKPEHMDEIELLDNQQLAREFLSHDKLQLMAEAGPAYTARDGNRLILCSAGLDESLPQASLIWCLMSVQARTHFVALTRAARRLISVASRPVVVASVQDGFAPGCRLLTLLGFEHVTEACFEGPDTAHYLIYRRFV